MTSNHIIIERALTLSCSGSGAVEAPTTIVRHASIIRTIRIAGVPGWTFDTFPIYDSLHNALYQRWLME